MNCLEKDLKERLKRKPILLMTHLILGYPSFEVNREVIRHMAENGVDCIELQIPFSEPIADGPVILKAGQQSLGNGTRVEDCLRFGEEMAKAWPQVHFLFMSYYNTLYQYGERAFLERCRDIGFCGNIIADLPPEEGASYIASSRELGLSPVPFFAPTSTDARMQEMGTHGEGFVYCVARRGVTGKHTEIDASISAYLARCRQATSLPLAVGFGISSRDDVRELTGKADMAVVGTATIKLVDAQGAAAVGPYIAGLRQD